MYQLARMNKVYYNFARKVIQEEQEISKCISLIAARRALPRIKNTSDSTDSELFGDTLREPLIGDEEIRNNTEQSGTYRTSNTFILNNDLLLSNVFVL